MGYVVRMPRIGSTMEEGAVLEWAVEEGESVSADDALCVVGSEGTTATVEAREAGVLRLIVVPEGSVVEPGTTIGLLADRDETLTGYIEEMDDAVESGTVDDAGRGGERTAPNVTDRVEEGRTVRVVTDSRYAGRYRASGTEVPFDGSESMGGGGTAPGPVEHLLGALGACLSLSVRTMAERDDVRIGEIETAVEGSPDHGPLESISVNVGLATDAGDGDVDRVLLKAERACYVERSLSSDLDVSVSWSRL